MKRIFILSALLLTMVLSAGAQRKMDQLDRGLVAIKTTDGVYCSWRIMGEEYYDVTYNLYRDGVKVAENLTVSNYADAAGSENSKYAVRAVVRGVEQEAGKEATVWTTNYMEITPPHHPSITSTLVPNDACCADVDGDGELEILMKFDNQEEISNLFPKEGHNGEYSIFEVFKMDGTLLWWVNCGPNMGDFQNNEQNIVAYDWDQDGKAEAVMRLEEGSVIHMKDGSTYTIGADGQNGTAWTNYRTPKVEGGVEWFTHYGNEFLVYCNGETGVPYQVMEYPLKRLEDGETDLNAAWGDGYGHRSTKHFFGAPCLDGRKASIFLARGIYTRHKMIAYDVNPATHELTERWRWSNNTASSPWYGQGYHNYAVADVDWDGRDEICFGSMVIDDNGKRLSTTGLGHGDAQHHGDFNPYIHGHEIYACNEDAPDNNYRDATTSKIYYRQTSNNDDGRAMMGNFSNLYPGCLGRSGHDTAISSVTNDHIPSDIAFDVNFRIYWDGDLLEETLNGTGTRNTAGRIYKPSTDSVIETLTGSLTNNDTKATPCYQGDLFGDWREEVMMRTADNKIRIYITTIPTEWRNYTLWHDHQYRQAMVWQMCGYNQPPHTSYFLGELEGITQAPPALTMTGRTEVKDGETIGTSLNNQHVMVAETKNASAQVQEGCAPYILTVNTPSHIIGHDNNNYIEQVYYTHTLTGGAFTGGMRLIKQGDGILELPNVVEKYTGNTDIWAGTLRFDGTMENSTLWLNRHTNLISDGGNFKGGIKADYNATIYPGGKNKTGTLTTTTLALGFGSRIVLDVNNDGTADQVTTTKLTIEKKDWQYGPQYDAPVLQIVQSDLAPGNYVLMNITQLEGSISDVIVEGMSGKKYTLTFENGKVMLNVIALRNPTDVTWDGGTDGIWDFADTQNFLSASGQKDFFVTGDAVTFNDQATNTTIKIEGEVKPGSVTFDNSSKDFTVEGTGSIIGDGTLTKKGTGKVTINNVNKFTGGTIIEDGKVIVSLLANSDGVTYGALGGTSNKITLAGGTLATAQNIVSTQPVSIGEGNGTIEVATNSKLTLNGAVNGRELTKTGAGTLELNGTAGYTTLHVNQGTVLMGENNGGVHQYPATVVLNGGTIKDPDNIYSYSTNKANVVVPEGKTGTWTLDARCDYKGKLTGAGTLTVNVTSVRSNMQGNWSEFEGTINFKNTKTGSYDPLLQWNNSYGLGKATVTGTFDNNGKNVAFGTIQGNATLTGSGTYTANDLSLKVTRGRGSNTNTTISVAGTLSVTGSINVTWSGTQPKLGETVTLWNVGRLSVSDNVVLNLPTLSEGLYWDTSDLLKAEGVLRVTDQPTDISVLMSNEKGEMSNEKWYSLDGRQLSSKPTTKGVYIRNGKKVVIK